MGADVTVEPDYRAWIESPGWKAALTAAMEQHEEIDKQVEASFDFQKRSGLYFRDAYNHSNLLRQMGLDWNSDVGIGVIPRPVTQSLLERLTAWQVPEPSDLDLGVDDDTRAEWHRYFVEKRAQLLGVLHRALEPGRHLAVST
jgi:hypothetical protein